MAVARVGYRFRPPRLRPGLLGFRTALVVRHLTKNGGCYGVAPCPVPLQGTALLHELRSRESGGSSGSRTRNAKFGILHDFCFTKEPKKVGYTCATCKNCLW